MGCKSYHKTNLLGSHQVWNRSICLANIKKSPMDRQVLSTIFHIWTLVERDQFSPGHWLSGHISFQKHYYALLTENRDPWKVPTNFLNNCSQPGHRLLFLISENKCPLEDSVCKNPNCILKTNLPQRDWLFNKTVQ